MNVILIMLDSLRKDHVGCYGNNWIKTPNLDALAKKGITFTRAFPEALPTLPVRRAMFTGMRTFPCRNYQRKKGDEVIIPGWEPIPENQVTMSEIFRHHGYRTAFFTSAYHMFKPSMNYHRGFEVWEWVRGQEADRYKTPLRRDINIEDPKYLPCDLAYGCVGHSLHHCLPNMQDWRKEEDWFPPRTFGKAIEWLERNQDVEEFLLVVDEFDPHEPWNAPEDILRLYFDTNKYQERRVINTHGGPYKFQEGEQEYTLAQYAGEVTLCDKYVGRLLNKAEELGLLDDTLIVALSDHGHNIMDHGVMHKVPSHLYPELMDLAFIISHPKSGHAGKVCDAFVSHHDVLPTLLSLAGLSPPLPVEGQNIWNWVDGEEIGRRTYMTSMFGQWVWCRDDKYVLISDLDGNQARLFDIQADPYHRKDIANETPEVCQRMYKRILDDAGGPLPRYDTKRQFWYDYPDVFAPGARVPSIDQMNKPRV